MATKKKALTKWEEQLAAKAAVATATEKNAGSGAPRLSVSGGQLQFQGASVPGNKLNVVVLDHCIEYVYYRDRYNPDDPQPPAAYALGRDEDELTWHEDSIPEYAGELCKDSDINQWGSADTGRGKACKNSRRLIMIPEDDLEDIAHAESAIFRLPVTSVKNWSRYVRQVADQFNRPPLGVLTELSVVPNAKTQYEVQFRLLGTIDDGETIGQLMELSESLESVLFAGYPKAEESALAPAPRKKVGGKKSPVTKRK